MLEFETRRTLLGYENQALIEFVILIFRYKILLDKLITHLKTTSMYMYDGYHFGGMHLIWWFVWVIFLFWVFALPYGMPGQRRRKDSALEILQKRFAAGELNNGEYLEKKEIIKNDFPKNR